MCVCGGGTTRGGEGESGRSGVSGAATGTAGARRLATDATCTSNTAMLASSTANFCSTSCPTPSIACPPVPSAQLRSPKLPCCFDSFFSFLGLRVGRSCSAASALAHTASCGAAGLCWYTHRAIETAKLHVSRQGAVFGVRHGTAQHVNESMLMSMRSITQTISLASRIKHLVSKSHDRSSTEYFLISPMCTIYSDLYPASTKHCDKE